jgi:hypothetical protein
MKGNLGQKEIGLKRPISLLFMMSKLLSFKGFVLGAQAARADFHVLGCAVNQDGGGMNISRPVAVGVALGVADVMTVKRGLAANIALHST